MRIKTENIAHPGIATVFESPSAISQQDCFDELMKRHHSQALSTAWRLLGSHNSLAEDAVQTAFQKAWENFSQLENPKRLKSWFFQILVNECRAVQRRHKTRKLLRQIFLPSSSVEMSDATADHGLQKRIHNAMAKLSPRQREAFVLVHLEGFTNQEAASAMGSPLGTLKSHLHRATETLRKQLHDIRPTEVEKKS